MKSVFERCYKKYDAWYDRNIFAYLSELEAIRKVLPRTGKGLEIGVGTARFSAPLGIKNGIDPARSMVKIARQRGINARVGRGEHLPYRSATFDYVAIIITLAFVKSAQKVLQEAKRVLKKKGKIIVGIVDRNSFLGRFYQKKRGIFYKQANFLSAEELVNLLKTLGFGRFSYYQTIFKLPDKIDSIERPRRGFGRGGFALICARKEKKS